MPERDPTRVDRATLVPVAVDRVLHLAAWGSEALAGRLSLDEAAERICGAAGDRVEGPGDAESLPVALGRLRSAGVDALRPVLPVPGDVSGLPGPTAFAQEAVRTGAAVVGVGAPAVGLVPDVTGGAVRWRRWRLDGRDVPVASLAEADRSLRMALLEATAALEQLDAARWPSDGWAPDGSRPPRHELPAAAPARARGLAERAARLWEVCRVALADERGPVSAGQLEQRRAALVALDRACRHALAAAYGWAAEDATRPLTGPG